MDKLRSLIRTILIESVEEPVYLSTIQDVRTALSQLFHVTLREAVNHINQKVPGPAVEEYEVFHEPKIDPRSRTFRDQHQVDETQFAKNFIVHDFGVAVSCPETTLDYSQYKSCHAMLAVVEDLLRAKFDEIGLDVKLHGKMLNWKLVLPYSMSGARQVVASLLFSLPNGFQKKVNIKRLEDWYIAHFPQHRTILDERAEDCTQVLRDMLREEGVSIPSVGDEMWVRFVKHMCGSSDKEKASLARGAWEELDRPDWMMRACAHLPLRRRKNILVECLVCLLPLMTNPQGRDTLEQNINKLKELCLSGTVSAESYNDFIDSYQASFRTPGMSQGNLSIVNLAMTIACDVLENDEPFTPLPKHLQILTQAGVDKKSLVRIIAKNVPDPSVKS